MKISVLPHKVTEQIAAGEIVENPASVIKELVENSLDAGATFLEIRLKGGGIEEISVFDNGHGLEASQLPLAFQRHATSKLQSLEQLYHSLNTLGFRGEALPSIASVSRVELTSRPRGYMVGCRICLEGGEVISSEEVGCPEGTEIKVRDLFFNTPARRKFLKSRRAEVARVSRLITAFSFSHPGVSFSCWSDEKLLFKSRGDGNILNLVAEAFGKEVSRSLVPMEEEEESDTGTIKIKGYLSPPYLTRSSRRYQSIVVNSRLVNSPLVSRALERGYRGLLQAHRFPVAVIYLEVPPGFLDVNIHPAKSEIRFHDNRAIETLVYRAVTRALQRSSPEYYYHGRDFSRKLKSRESTDDPVVNFNGQQEKIIEEDTTSIGSPQRNLLVSEEHTTGEEKESLWEENITSTAYSGHTREKDGGEHRESSGSSGEKEEAGEVEIFNSQVKSRVIGQFLSTYIVLQKEKRLVLIDQHAAHERVLYQKFLREYEEASVSRVGLVVPVTVEVPSSVIQMFSEIENDLEKIGFKIEPFGNNTCIVREVPSFLVEHFQEEMMRDIVEEINELEGIASDKIMEIFKVFACKGAVKAKQPLDQKEMENLVEQWEQVEYAGYCPHGRPVAVSFSAQELQRGFLRGEG